eukprot:1157634-Pelagomonas_calceolata.AAC.12
MAISMPYLFSGPLTVQTQNRSLCVVDLKWSQYWICERDKISRAGSYPGLRHLSHAQQHWKNGRKCTSAEPERTHFRGRVHLLD